MKQQLMKGNWWFQEIYADCDNPQMPYVVTSQKGGLLSCRYLMKPKDGGSIEFFQTKQRFDEIRSKDEVKKEWF